MKYENIPRSQTQCIRIQYVQLKTVLLQRDDLREMIMSDLKLEFWINLTESLPVRLSVRNAICTYAVYSDVLSLDVIHRKELCAETGVSW